MARAPKAQSTTQQRGSGVPRELLAKLRSICLRLPEAYEEPAWVGTRWMIRKRNFAHVVQIDAGWPPAYARAAGSDGPLCVLTFRAPDSLRDALEDAGSRFFVPEWGTRWGTKVVGIKLVTKIDWDEVQTLIGESYRVLAPKSLTSRMSPDRKSRS